MRPPPGLTSEQSFFTSSSHAFRIRCRLSFPPAASSGDSSRLEGGICAESAEYALRGTQGLAPIPSVAAITITRNVVLEGSFVMRRRFYRLSGAHHTTTLLVLHV